MINLSAIYSKLHKVVSGKYKISSYEFKKNIATKEKWDALILSIDQPNLMQTWDYGEAMNQIGWETERYLVFYEGVLIAFFQAFKKRYLYVASVKIQRGPLFINKEVLNTHLASVLSIIRQKWSFWKLQLLQIEFELPLLPKYYELITNLGFRRTKNFTWESTQIDLTLSEENLLANMKSNWRNSLRKSIKNELQVIKTTNKADFEWLIEQYELFKKNKHIIGVSRDLLYALWDNMIKENSICIFLALTGGGKRISGVVIAFHGTGCSYLLGWNGELGKQLKAHNFLLWHAIKDTKSHGALFFDLGGVLSSIPKYKTIADFKLGLNGKKYILIGEFY